MNSGSAGQSCIHPDSSNIEHLHTIPCCHSEQTPEEGGNYVCFRGPKGELPKGSDGSYGTSLTYFKAMDPASDVIVAYKQNGRWLTPDHGFPVR